MNEILVCHYHANYDRIRRRCGGILQGTESASQQTLGAGRKRNATPRHTPSPSEKKKPPKFRVKPFKGGFAPGVDPTQLNRLNDQLEVEEYVRKANFDNP